MAVLIDADIGFKEDTDSGKSSVEMAVAMSRGYRV